jgi:hypothetical protein
LKEKVVFKRFMLIGLVALSMSVLLGADGIAATCKLRSSSGTCLLWSGSVLFDPIVTDSQGGVNNHPMVIAEARPTGDGVAACSNSGSKNKVAPGILVVTVDLTPDPPLPPDENFDFVKAVPITRSNVTNGVATLNGVRASFTDTQKKALQKYCPNDGWTIVDVVPCTIDVSITLSNDFGTIDGASYQCTLPSCQTLEFDSVNRRFDQKRYIDNTTGMQCGK